MKRKYKLLICYYGKKFLYAVTKNKVKVKAHLFIKLPKLVWAAKTKINFSYIYIFVIYVIIIKFKYTLLQSKVEIHFNTNIIGSKAEKVFMII